MTAASSVSTNGAASSPEESRPLPSRVRPYDRVLAKHRTWTGTVFRIAPTPSMAEWRAMGEALWEGDGPMDELVEWMFEYGSREAKALFQQAVDRGIASVPDAPEPLRKFFRTVDAEPPWLDRVLLDEAALFTHRAGLAATFVLRDMAQMTGFLFAGFNRTLIMTGDYKTATGRRLAETGKWWMDCTERRGMERLSAGFRTTLRVRFVHAMVRRHLLCKEEWDSSVWGVPISQPDMLATQMAFSVITLAGLRLLGVFATEREATAMMHLWRYAGWLMGVDERWGTNSEQEGRALLYRTLMTQARPDWTSRELGQAFSREPLGRTYPWFREYPRLQKLMLRLVYHQHLSVSSVAVTPKQRELLGIPKYTLPWYPMLSAPPRFLQHTLLSLTESGREREARAGRRAQRFGLKVVFGDHAYGIIEPSAGHPAHV